MAQVTLIRHGQANTQARDEHSYDKLSPLGHQQGQWLGQYLNDTNDFHPRVYCGTLQRHLETVQAMNGQITPVQDARLNEMHYFALAQLLEEQHGVPIPEAREEFCEHLPKVFDAWRKDEIKNAPESFESFSARVSDALNEISQGPGPALVVTSGGVIGMAMRQALELDISGFARMVYSIMNTSMHGLFPIAGRLSPTLYNAVPHLELPGREHAKTHL